MNEAAGDVKAVIDVRYLGRSAIRTSLRTLSEALREAAAASAPGDDNAAHARVALRLVEDAATRIPAGKDAVMAPMRLAAQHLRAMQTASSESERRALAQARRSMSESLFEAAELPN